MTSGTSADRYFSDKVIVITGASSGFGKGAALEFARSGGTVIVSARRSQLLDEVAKECDSAGGHGIAIPADVSFKDEVEHLAKSAVSATGRIDVWVNNAGTGVLGRFEEIPLEEHVQVIETDLLGTLYGSYFAMRQFRKQGFGTLINVSSMIGKVPSPYFASYAAAKFGVVGLSASIRQELKENDIDGIRVSTILPTSMDTPFFDHAANYLQRKTVPIPPIEEAQKVIDTIVKMARDPEDEITIGTSAPFMTFAHRMAPDLTEAMMARQVHKAEVEKAPLAENTPGAVQRPMAKGKSVGGGWKK